MVCVGRRKLRVVVGRWWGGVVFAAGQGHDDDESEVRFPLNETANV